jgi:hypothetical protein
MSDNRQHWSRRRLLQYSGVGIGLAVAGCNGSSESDDQDGTELPDEPTTQFELAGNGAAGFREWLLPEFALESATDGEQRQLYQFVDYGQIPDGEMEQQRERRATFADQIGIAPGQIERELLLGPLDNNLPYRVLFGTYDKSDLVETFEGSGFERTSEPGNFVIFDELIAISEDTILEHPSSNTVVEQAMAGGQEFEEFEEEMKVLLDLIPAGPQVTINSRDDFDDIVLDGLTILELSGPVTTHGIRTLIFTDESAATSERVREIDIDDSPRNKVVSKEIHGRVAMIESRRE